MRRPHVLHLRVGDEIVEFLDRETIEYSTYIRSLILKAKELEEARPLQERITETTKYLSDQQKNLDTALMIAQRSATEEQEATGSINAFERSVERLKAKLAYLESLKPV